MIYRLSTFKGVFLASGQATKRSFVASFSGRTLKMGKKRMGKLNCKMLFKLNREWLIIASKLDNPALLYATTTSQYVQVIDL